MRAKLERALQEAGLHYRIVGPEMVAEMARSLAQLLDRGIMPAEIYSEYSASLIPDTPEGEDEICSLVVVAAPSPALKAAFDLGDRVIEAVIPPTYVSGQTRRRTLEVLLSVLEPAGFHARRVTLPAKMLAVRTGLAQYGRNGIVYVEGLGSFARLDIYATDAELTAPDGADASLAPERLPVPPRMRTCLTCSWCYHACPTKCISSTGDRIDPLRCLTFVNEHVGEWPSWLEPAAHNSLVGCMVCQRVCRFNQENGFIVSETLVVEFDREETAIILENRLQADLPPDLKQKLESLDLADYSTVLGRNLQALAER